MSDKMDPKRSPSRTSGVRRLNNTPVYVALSIVGGFLLIMFIVAADRSAQQNQQVEAELEQVGTSSFAKDIAGQQQGGIVKRAEPPPPPELPVLDEFEEPATETPLAPISNYGEFPVVQQPFPGELQPIYPELQQPPVDEQTKQIRDEKLRMLQKAIQAPTGIQFSGVENNEAFGSAVELVQPGQIESDRLSGIQGEDAVIDSVDPAQAYQARLAQIKRKLSTDGINVGGNDSSSSGSLFGGNSGETLTVTATDNKGDERFLNTVVEAPRNPFELRAGTVLPATLITGINSDLPGQILAQVSQSVYDTPTGRHMLIPQGTRLLGSYSSDVAFGQKRVMVFWEQLVFPDGKILNIGKMPGADSAGYSGLKDKVNNHFFRLYGSAILLSAVVAGATLTQDDSSDGNTQRASDSLSEALGQQLGQTTAQVIGKNLNVSPTLEIRPGYLFNVFVTQHIKFSKAYESFDYR